MPRVTDELYFAIKKFFAASDNNMSATAKHHHLSRTAVRYALANGIPSNRQRKRRSAGKLIDRRRQVVAKLAGKKKIIKSKGGPRGGSVRIRRVPVFVSVRKILIEAKQLLPPTVKLSLSTVRRDLKAAGFCARRRPNGVQEFEGDRPKRFAFCCKIGRLPAVYVEAIIFTDEKWFFMPDTRTWEWCRKGMKPSSKAREKFPIKLLYWGAIGIGFRRLVRINGSLTSTDYVNQILQPLIKSKDFDVKRHVFQQDNARPHIAENVQSFFTKHGVQLLLDWPARSPELSPIETVWGIVTRVLDEDDFIPQTPDELAVAVEAAWNSIPQQVFDNLCRGFSQRCSRCARRNGAC